MKLKEEVVKVIRTDKKLRSKLTLGMDTTSSTLYRWMQTGDIKMTSALFLDIVSKHTGMDTADMIQKEEREPISI